MDFVPYTGCTLYSWLVFGHLYSGYRIYIYVYIRYVACEDHYGGL